MEFSRQEYWSGLPFPSPGDLPDSGIQLSSSRLLNWQADSLLLAPPGKPRYIYIYSSRFRDRERQGDGKRQRHGETEVEDILVIEEADSHRLDISHAWEEEFAKYSEPESHLIVIISTCCHVISESAYRWWFYFFPSKNLQAPSRH